VKPPFGDWHELGEAPGDTVTFLGLVFVNGTFGITLIFKFVGLHIAHL
jgi:hypothetical protein